MLTNVLFVNLPKKRPAVNSISSNCIMLPITLCTSTWKWLDSSKEKSCTTVMTNSLAASAPFLSNSPSNVAVNGRQAEFLKIINCVQSLNKFSKSNIKPYKNSGFVDSKTAWSINDRHRNRCGTIIPLHSSSKRVSRLWRRNISRAEYSEIKLEDKNIKI